MRISCIIGPLSLLGISELFAYGAADGASNSVLATAGSGMAWMAAFAVSAAGGLFAFLFVICRRRSKLRELEDAARREFSTRLIRSQEEERQRIASELHDSLGQDLLLIKTSAQLALAERNTDPKIAARLDQIQSIAAKAVKDVRAITGDLRPPELDRLGLAAALEAMAAQVSETTRLEIDCGLDNVDHQVAKEDEINVYRIVQECLTNALKHSGANRVQIVAHRVNGALKVRVEDDGRGFEPAECFEPTDGTGMGLVGLAERTRSLGGQLHINSAPGEGARITLTIPVQNHEPKSGS